MNPPIPELVGQNTLQVNGEVMGNDLLRFWCGIWRGWPRRALGPLVGPAPRLPHIQCKRRRAILKLPYPLLSFDPATGAHLPRKVMKLYRGETDVWIGLTYTQNGIKKPLSTTPEHPFLTPNGQFAPISLVTLADERRAA